jgi:hypothetical protein
VSPGLVGPERAAVADRRREAAAEPAVGPSAHLSTAPVTPNGRLAARVLTSIPRIARARCTFPRVAASICPATPSVVDRDAGFEADVADELEAGCRGRAGAVDPDDLAVGVHESGPPGVARLDRRVHLDHAVQRLGLAPFSSAAVMVWFSAVTDPSGRYSVPPRSSAQPKQRRILHLTCDESAVETVLRPDAHHPGTRDRRQRRTHHVAVYVGPVPSTRTEIVFAPSMTGCSSTRHQTQSARSEAAAAPAERRVDVDDTRIHRRRDRQRVEPILTRIHAIDEHQATLQTWGRDNAIPASPPNGFTPSYDRPTTSNDEPKPS